MSGRGAPPAGASPAASRVRTAGAYALFALAATLVNLGVQRAASAAWPWPMRDLAALAAGTGAGLAVKFFLDRRWIFAVRSRGDVRDLGTFARYAATGVLTTGIFWAVELGFLSAFRTEWARYAGGAVGLCLGYGTKYFLDKRLVFGPPRE